jgi:hyperosmotically inducible protein
LFDAIRMPPTARIPVRARQANPGTDTATSPSAAPGGSGGPLSKEALMRKRLGVLFAVVAATAIGLACASDAGITTKVKAKISADRTITNGDQIAVSTQNGVVTLAGTVDTDASKQRALKLASETEGVKSVVDNLTAPPAVAGNTPSESGGPEGSNGAVSEAAGKMGEKVDDAAITTELKTKLIADTQVAARTINVDTKDGVVTLKGTVKSAEERDKAIQIARDTRGVQRVDDQLTVKTS